MARRAGLRVRVRGPHRCGVGAARGARGPRRRDRLPAVRARPAGVRVAPAHRRGSRRGSRPAGSRSCRRAAATSRNRRSPTSSAACSTTRRRLRSRSTAPSASSRARARAARSSSSARSCSPLLRAGTPARADRDHLPERRALARAARDRARRRSAFPYVARRRGAPRADAVRPGAGGDAALRVARRDARRPVHVPALAVLRARATRGRLRRGPPARPRGADAGPRGRGGGEAPRRAAARRSRAARRGRRRSTRSASSRRACSAARTGSRARRVGEASRLDLRAYEALVRLARRARPLAGGRRASCRATRWSPRSSARRCARCGATSPAGSRWSTSCARALAGSTSSFVLGLEEGSLPRRGSSSPFLDDDARRALDARGARLERPDSVSRDRYLFYTACTRASERLYLVREAATDEGAPREPSPFWDEVQSLFDPEDVRRWTRRRPLSALTWTLDDAPTERERLRALAELAARDAGQADALARANGWERRLDRAVRAFARPTRVTHPLVLEQLGSRADVQRHGARAVRRLLVRVVRRAVPRPEVDRRRGGCEAARLGRAQRALQVLHAAAEGARRREARRWASRTAPCGSCARASTRRSPGVRMEMTEMQARELDQTLWRDLEAVVHEECATRAAARSAPVRGRVRERARRAGAAARARPRRRHHALREDRPDRRRPVQRPRDRAGLQVGQARALGRARSRRSCACRSRSTCSCCATSSASSRSAASTGRSPASGRRAGSSARARGRRCPAMSGPTTSTRRRSGPRSRTRRTTARRLAGRIRGGDVEHDPKGGDCPAWCDLWPMCRVERA